MRAKEFVSERDLSFSGFLNNKDFLDKIQKPFIINNNHDVPYVAGCSNDRNVIYFDQDLPERVKGIDILKYISFHEKVESALMDMYGLDYQPAHEIATKFEKKLVEHDGIDWAKYCKAVDPYIKKLDKKSLRHCPKDLDLKPYIDEKDFKKFKSK